MRRENLYEVLRECIGLPHEEAIEKIKSSEADLGVTRVEVRIEKEGETPYAAEPSEEPFDFSDGCVMVVLKDDFNGPVMRIYFHEGIGTRESYVHFVKSKWSEVGVSNCAMYLSQPDEWILRFPDGDVWKAVPGGDNGSMFVKLT